MPKDASGLSIQAAWAEAEAEGNLSEEPSVEPDSSTPDPEPSADGEQSVIESVEEKQGLFADLNDNDQGEQSDKELHEVTVNGETFNVSLSELVNGYQRQEDYTRGRQEIAEERKRLEKASTFLEAYEANPLEVAQRLWETARQGKPNAQVSEPVQSTTPDIETLVNERVSQALESHPMFQELEDQRMLSQLNATFEAIEKDYNVPLTADDKVFVLQEAQKSGVNDIEAVFAKLYHRVGQSRKAAENVKANSTATGFGGDAAEGVAPQPAKPEKFSSFREAMNETLVEENVGESALSAAISNI